jgi:hypothetical protein
MRRGKRREGKGREGKGREGKEFYLSWKAKVLSSFDEDTISSNKSPTWNDTTSFWIIFSSRLLMISVVVWKRQIENSERSNLTRSLVHTAHKS